MEFIVLTFVSIFVVILIVRYSLGKREINPTNNVSVLLILTVLEIICMLLGKFGANWGLPWWIYYPIPMLLTIFFPPIYLRMNRIEAIKYLILTFVSAPVVHIVFSLFGWKNYMPFINVPSIF